MFISRVRKRLNLLIAIYLNIFIVSEPLESHSGNSNCFIILPRDSISDQVILTYYVVEHLNGKITMDGILKKNFKYLIINTPVVLRFRLNNINHLSISNGV